jgi:hypothetical protein
LLTAENTENAEIKHRFCFFVDSGWSSEFSAASAASAVNQPNGPGFEMDQLHAPIISVQAPADLRSPSSKAQCP